MITRICDICGKKASEHFKVKKEKEIANIIDVGFILPERRWISIDICKECYQKLFDARKED